MDINQALKLQTHTWNLEIPMDDHILHDQLPLNPIWPSFPLQTPFSTSTTPTHLPSATPVYSTHHNDQLGHLVEEGEEPEEELSAMKEMLYKIAAMQPVDIDPSTIRKPKRRNVRISDDPQSVAARHRRERISEKIRILKRLVPGGTKMDTASMLDEAIRYGGRTRRRVKRHERDVVQDRRDAARRHRPFHHSEAQETQRADQRRSPERGGSSQAREDKRKDQNS
ncbi:hypothetical protein GOBAR_AA31003 [Gossypium barbadense]|uniref:BHLH domain-containing protein n=1 Tax=Gossypium barbadense TaxID=3634 RepID=A0A2P5WF59_GOSBA|nr:hypothetical protein GOBAR_AA31003 [Gossypium barbadense]